MRERSRRRSSGRELEDGLVGMDIVGGGLGGVWARGSYVPRIC